MKTAALAKLINELQKEILNMNKARSNSLDKLNYLGGVLSLLRKTVLEKIS